MSDENQRMEDASNWAKYGAPSGGPRPIQSVRGETKSRLFGKNDLIRAIIGGIIGYALYLLLPRELRSGGIGSLFSQLPTAIIAGFAIGLLGRIIFILGSVGTLVLIAILVIILVLRLMGG